MSSSYESTYDVSTDRVVELAADLKLCATFVCLKTEQSTSNRLTIKHGKAAASEQVITNTLSIHIEDGDAGDNYQVGVGDIQTERGHIARYETGLRRAAE